MEKKKDMIKNYALMYDGRKYKTPKNNIISESEATKILFKGT